MSRRKITYALGDPRDGSVYYVGESVDPLHRLYSHVYESKLIPEYHPVTRDIVACGRRPVLVILAGTFYEGTENESIHKLKAAGHLLVNSKKGSL